MSNNDIGQFVRSCRRELGLTQEQLAEKAGISVKSISRWENNSKDNYQLQKIADLCEALNIGADELFAGARRDQTDAASLNSAAMLKMSELMYFQEIRFSAVIGAVSLMAAVFVGCFPMLFGDALVRTPATVAVLLSSFFGFSIVGTTMLLLPSIKSLLKKWRARNDE